MISRRALLATTAIIPVALVGCAEVTNLLDSLPSWVGDLSAIIKGAQTMLPSLSTALGAGSSVVTTVTTLLNDAASLVSGITASSVAAVGQSVVIQIETYFNSIVATLQPILASIPGVGTAIGLAVIAMPVIEQAVNLVISYLTPSTTSTATAVAPTVPVTTPTTPGAAVVMAHPTAQQALDMIKKLAAS